MPYAFTLSEVLITLVIIGIIAAITIPAISRASEKYILRNQFKKTYSTIMNAINKTDTDLGGNTVCYYNVAGSSGETRFDCRAFFQQLPDNLNIQKTCKGNAKRDGCIPDPYMKEYTTSSYATGFSQANIETNNYVYNLADGAFIIYYGTGSMALFMVDINGAKGPNEYGKDVFIFYIRSDGINGLSINNDILNAGWVDSNTRQKAYFRTLSDIYKE